MPAFTPSVTIEALLTGTLITAIVAIVLSQWNYFSPQCPSSCPTPDAAHLHTGYFEYECAGKPHQHSWGSWWHPQRNEEVVNTRGQGAGAVTKDWNILYHLGGNGPWVEKVVDVVDGGIVVPEGCEIEQVHMMSRHAERYPTRRAGNRMKALVERMKQSDISFKGDLAFFNEWELFWSDDAQIEQLTTTGPFSGSLGSFTTGVRLRTRYQHLLELARMQRPKTPIRYWASDSQRVIDTARYFGLGFFGLNSSNTTHLEVISEASDLGADTLTPGDTCLKYVEDEEEGHDKGYKMTGAYRSTYLPTIRERLRKHNPDIEFTDDEVYAMQEMCGFETTVRGRSDWCDVFTQNEFLSFEYARDLLHYYRAGPGTHYAGAMGWLWLNATMNLMLEGQKAGPLFFSFVHDGDIAPMMTALDIINDAEHLPMTHIPHNRRWRKSQVSPMGGRIIFELLSCKADRSHGQEKGKFVRININDGITAIPDCHSGPGGSCPLQGFVDRTKRKGEDVGNFRDVCALGEEAAEKITFLHQ